MKSFASVPVHAPGAPRAGIVPAGGSAFGLGIARGGAAGAITTPVPGTFTIGDVYGTKGNDGDAIGGPCGCGPVTTPCADTHVPGRPGVTVLVGDLENRQERPVDPLVVLFDGLEDGATQRVRLLSRDSDLVAPRSDLSGAVRIPLDGIDADGKARFVAGPAFMESLGRGPRHPGIRPGFVGAFVQEVDGRLGATTTVAANEGVRAGTALPGPLAYKGFLTMRNIAAAEVQRPVLRAQADREPPAVNACALQIGPDPAAFGNRSPNVLVRKDSYGIEPFAHVTCMPAMASNGYLQPVQVAASGDLVAHIQDTRGQGHAQILRVRDHGNPFDPRSPNGIGTERRVIFMDNDPTSFVAVENPYIAMAHPFSVAPARMTLHPAVGGIARFTGLAQSTRAGSIVEIYNQSTRQTTRGTTRGDGSFDVPFARSGDQPIHVRFLHAFHPVVTGDAGNVPALVCDLGVLHGGVCEAEQLEGDGHKVPCEMAPQQDGPQERAFGIRLMEGGLSASGGDMNIGYRTMAERDIRLTSASAYVPTIFVDSTGAVTIDVTQRVSGGVAGAIDPKPGNGNGSGFQTLPRNLALGAHPFTFTSNGKVLATATIEVSQGSSVSFPGYDDGGRSGIRAPVSRGVGSVHHFPKLALKDVVILDAPRPITT